MTHLMVIVPWNFAFVISFHRFDILYKFIYIYFMTISLWNYQNTQQIYVLCFHFHTQKLWMEIFGNFFCLTHKVYTTKEKSLKMRKISDCQRELFFLASIHWKTKRNYFNLGSFTLQFLFFSFWALKETAYIEMAELRIEHMQ